MSHSATTKGHMVYGTTDLLGRLDLRSRDHLVAAGRLVDVLRITLSPHQFCGGSVPPHDAARTLTARR